MNNFVDYAKKSSFDPYKSTTISTTTTNPQNNILNAFGDKSNEKNNFISLNNESALESNKNIPDFYKMIDEEKQRRLVRN